MIIPPFNYKDFYRKYQVDYWLYKIVSLKNIFDNFDLVKNILYKDITDTDDDSLKLMLKTEIHFTYYQIIETLFELIFALQKDPELLWYYISFSRFKSYEKIEKIAKGKIDFLNDPISVVDKITRIKYDIMFIEWLFYSSKLNIDDKDRSDNFNNIIKTLIIFAKDFTNRDDYNAFKHSLRIIPCNTGITLSKKDDQNNIKSLYLKGSDGFEFLVKHTSKTGFETIKKVTKSYDFKRDFNMSIIGIQLISNILRSKRAYFYNEKQQVYLFHKSNINEINNADYLISESFLTIEEEG